MFAPLRNRKMTFKSFKTGNYCLHITRLEGHATAKYLRSY
jgi:hypothetical protein